MTNIANTKIDLEGRKLVGLLYFTTAALATFASALVTTLGMLASLVLFAGFISLFLPPARWNPWLPVVGSGILILYFLPLHIWQAFKYKGLVLVSMGGILTNLIFLALLILTFLVSLKRLRG